MSKKANYWRKAKPEDFLKQLQELELEMAKLRSKSYVGENLQNMSCRIRNIRKEIAVIKTISRERGL